LTVRARSGTAAEATVEFSIPTDHPALPGHFPGAPVVPGALLLAEGLQRLEAVLGTPIAWQRMESAKFLRPVSGGLVVTVALKFSGDRQARVTFDAGGESVAEVGLVIGPPTRAGRS
jgi:3-hydroxyacyl-[acyl-carrier-protein] dehydratase